MCSTHDYAHLIEEPSVRRRCDECGAITTGRWCSSRCETTSGNTTWRADRGLTGLPKVEDALAYATSLVLVR